MQTLFWHIIYRMAGVEPGSKAWEACMMPLQYMRFIVFNIFFSTCLFFFWFFPQRITNIDLHSPNQQYVVKTLGHALRRIALPPFIAKSMKPSELLLPSTTEA
jgi:hypothetical protein